MNDIKKNKLSLMDDEIYGEEDFGDSKMHKQSHLDFNGVDHENTITGLQRHLDSRVRTESIQSLAKCRGIRCRIIRQMLGLSLHEFSDLVGIEHGSMGRIERGNTCLSIVKAKNICSHLYDKKNMIVTPKWLLSGKGKAIIEHVEESVDISASLLESFKTNKPIPEYLTQYAAIGYVYRKCYTRQKPINMFVNDSTMEPIYQKGDMVGGLLVDPKAYNDLKGSPCIIMYKNNTQSVRLVYGSDEGYLILSCMSKTGAPVCAKFNEIDAIYEINFAQKTPIPHSDLISDEENPVNILQMDDLLNIGADSDGEIYVRKSADKIRSTRG